MRLADYMTALEKFRINQDGTDSGIIKSHIPLLRQLDLVQNSSVALFDMSSLKYCFLTSEFKFLLGLEPGTALDEGVSYFFDLMHPEDIAQFFDTSIQSFSFLYSQPKEKRKCYRTCQDFRIHRSDGEWIRLIQQIIVLELDIFGNIWLVMMVNDISPLKDIDISSRRYMEYMPTGERVLFSGKEAESKSPITTRELEILCLISRGYQSRDIADYLGISVCTVNNHRQHILEKMDAVNTAEAVNYANNLNLLDS